MAVLSRREFIRRTISSAGLLAAGYAQSACNRAAESTTMPSATPVASPAGPSPASSFTPPPAISTTGPEPTRPTATIQPTARPTPAAPLGVGKGIHPGRVVWTHNPQATSWDGVTGYWWEARYTDQSAVSAMLSKALQALTGQPGDGPAWQALFKYYNDTHGRKGVEYRTGEKVAVKINLNSVASRNYHENGVFTSPYVLVSVLDQLVHAGVQPEDISVYDAIRYVPPCIDDARVAAGLKSVHFADWTGGDGCEQAVRDTSMQVRWSEDLKGSPTYLPTCVMDARFVINLASLKGHNLAGFTACAKNHFGTLMNDLKGSPTINSPQGANLHATVAAHDYNGGDPEWIWTQRPMASYNALVDLMAHPHLGEKTVLYMIDGLYAAQNQGAKLSLASRWASAPFNGYWTSSLFLSQDNVAIDSVALDFLSSEPTITALPDILPPHNTADNYLHEASQIGRPPSGTVYQGAALQSLGVHEHWDGSDTKAYARNRHLKEGIELVQL